MVIHFGDNMDASLSYANTAVKTFGSWFVLIILCILSVFGALILCTGIAMLLYGIFAQTNTLPAADMPMNLESWQMMLFFGIFALAAGLIVTLISACFLGGIQLRVFRGTDLNFSRPGKMFCEGLIACIIMFLYTLPYGIVTSLTALGPIHNPVYYVLVCILIPVVLLAVTIMISLMGLVRFAKEKSFGAAFQIREICRIISAMGWLRYLGYICLLGLIIGVVELVILLIPIIGIFVIPIVMAFVLLFQGRFIANLYETADA